MERLPDLPKGTEGQKQERDSQRKEPIMKNRSHHLDGKMELTRLDRIVLHVRCLWRDHRYYWHLAGIGRDVMLP
jgi:hypothetical protein